MYRSCDKCGGFTVPEDLEDRAWNTFLNGWRCVNCGRRGDFTGRDYGEVGQAPDRHSGASLEGNLDSVPSGVLMLGRKRWRSHD